MPEKVAILVYKVLQGVELVIYFENKSNVAVYWFFYTLFYGWKCTINIDSNILGVSVEYQKHNLSVRIYKLNII